MARPPIHPGEILASELDELRMSAALLSQELRIPIDHLDPILAGTRDIDAEPASRLGAWFGTGAQLWLNLHRSYERRLGERKLETGDSM